VCCVRADVLCVWFVVAALCGVRVCVCLYVCVAKSAEAKLEEKKEEREAMANGELCVGC